MKKLSLPQASVVDDLMNNQQSCNGCTACCSVVGVEEFGKPYYAKCEHAGADCCNAYKDRPLSCRQYACMWKLRLVDDAEAGRPDKCGFLFTLVLVDDELFFDVYRTMPTEPTASEMEQLNRHLEVLGANYPEVAEKAKGVRLYPYGSKVSVGYDLRPPYPTDTKDIGNLYLPDPDQPHLYHHLSPEDRKRLGV